MSPKASPPPNFSFKMDSQSCWNAPLSQSDSALLNWKLQRSSSPNFEIEGGRIKKDGVQFIRKGLLRGRDWVISGGEQFSSTKSSVTQGSRDNSTLRTRMRQLEFNEKLKKAIVSNNQPRPYSPPRRRKNHDTSPLRCVGSNKILMKVKWL